MLQQAAVLVAAFLTGITGFGFNALALPVLAVTFEPHHAVVVGLLVGLLLFSLVFALPGVRGAIDMRLVRTLFMWSLPGLPLGALLLNWTDARTLRLVIGALTFGYASVQLLGRLPFKTMTRRAAPVVGLLSGVLSSSVSLGGTPVMLFLIGLGGGTPRSLRATAVAYVVLTTVASLTILFFGTAYVTMEALRDAVTLAPAALVGLALGAVAFRYISASLFVRLSLIMLAAVGLFALIAALR
ncbi:MAG: sulfite exporter TauE/SafE family protein [Chloroflexi bacterium]|nr:sulfite exporter TauE/SafE family protein [Chloroflexota bacterium]MBV9897026.1 sulfite exporter TauE/SafE family protein [Chloroflexota bacterium]